MPRRDSRGPFGMGPMTGRAAGYCAGNVNSGVTSFIPGRRLGRLGSGILRGSGRCLGLGCFLIQHILTQTDERDQVFSLEQQATQLENKLQAVRKEIAEAKARKEVD